MSALLRRNLILACIFLSLMGLAARPALSQITSLDFGSVTVGQSGSQVLTKTLYLSGNYTSATIDTPYITGPDKADFKITQDGFTGGPYYNGAMLSVTITFTPRGPGAEQATLDGSGTVQPGNVPLNFIPVTLTGKGVAPPPPPVTISAAKLEVPSIISNSDGSLSYSFSVHFKGSGSGEIKGHWVVDGTDQQPQNLGTLSLSGTWQDGPSLVLPRSKLLKHHTINFAFDDGTQATELIIEDTGYDTTRNEWQFNNLDYDTNENQKPIGGYCLGLCLVDASYYKNYQTQSNIPSLYKTPASLPLQIHSDINVMQKVGNNRKASPNGITFKRLQSYSTTSDQLSNESVIIRTPLEIGNLSVIILYTFPFDNGIYNILNKKSHALVAFGVLDVNDAYNSASPDTSENVRRFLVYDPDLAGGGEYLDLIDTADEYNMDYGGYDYLSAE